MSTHTLRVVHIFSPSYAGSTWLNLLLGAHSTAMSVGEIKSILKVNAAICTIHGEACPVWPRVVVDDPGRNIYHQLHEITGRTCFVTNNSRKYLFAQRDPGIDERFINLVRDGRAVVASHLRKYDNRSPWEASRIWRREIRRNARLMRRQPKQSVCDLTYERLKADTAGELKRLCTFIGIEFEPAMIAFWQAEQHFLGGNRGTLFSMLKATGKDLPDDPDQRTEGERPNWDVGYYQDKAPGQFVDERWRRELSPAAMRAFRWVAGRMNRRLGYVD